MSYSKRQKIESSERAIKNGRGVELCKQVIKLTTFATENFKENWEMFQIPEAFGIEMQNARTLRRELESTIKSIKQQRALKNQIRARAFSFNIEGDAQPLILLLLFHVQSNYCCRYWMRDDITKNLLQEKVIDFQLNLKFKADNLVITNQILSKVAAHWIIRFGNGRKNTHKIAVNQLDEPQADSYKIKMSRVKFKKLIDECVTKYQQRQSQHLVARREAFKKISLERGYYIEKDWLFCMTDNRYQTVFYHPEVATFLKGLPFESNSEETNWADVVEIHKLMANELEPQYAEFFLNSIYHSVIPRMAIYPPR